MAEEENVNFNKAIKAFIQEYTDIDPQNIILGNQNNVVLPETEDYAIFHIMDVQRRGKGEQHLLSPDKNNDFECFELSELPVEKFEEFLNRLTNWEQENYGLFLGMFNIVTFVIIINDILSKEYKLKYEWIGGADPYKAWKEEQDNTPKDAIY